MYKQANECINERIHAQTEQATKQKSPYVKQDLILFGAVTYKRRTGERNNRLIYRRTDRPSWQLPIVPHLAKYKLKLLPAFKSKQSKQSRLFRSKTKEKSFELDNCQLHLRWIDLILHQCKRNKMTSPVEIPSTYPVCVFFLLLVVITHLTRP